MKRNHKNRDMMTPAETKKTIGDNLNFAAAEAYKLLRTNLEFSLPSEKKCKIIGVTSALRGEGKSTTAINIAYTIAQTKKNVLLIEADLRLSTVAKRLQLRTRPGLTNMMIGQFSGNDVLQKSGLHPNLWVITAGDTPPNPAELLGSKPMEIMFKAMSELFDCIVVDLPPVTAVTDALVVSKHLDGMLVVVRQDYCDRGSVDETVRQLRFAGTKILGFVMTGADTHKKTYKRYGSYGDYKQPTSRESGK